MVFDLLNSYYSAKVSRYRLHVMWIKPKQIDLDWDDPLILLWYDCTSHIDTNATKGGRKTQTIQLQTQAQMTGTADLLQITRSHSKCWVKTYTPSVTVSHVSGFRDLDDNIYVNTSSPDRDDSLYPAGSSPWRAELSPSVASTNPSFLLALAPAALTASVSDVPFGTLFEDATWKGIQFGDYRFKMQKGDVHNAAFEDVSVEIPDPTPPTVPYGLEALGYDSNVNCYWYQTEATMDHWHIYRRTKLGAGIYSAWVLIGQPTLKTYNDGTAVNGTTYQYTVSAVDGDGEESTYAPATPDVTPLALVPVPTPPPPIVLPPAMNNIRRAVGTSISMSVLPCPDGTVDTPDKPQASWLYPGITISAPPIDYSTGSEIPNPAALDGEALTCASTALDGEALTCSATAEDGEEI
jgi:hypothetical protein